MARLRVGVLISGSGTNLQASHRRIATGADAPSEIALVLSNRADAFGLTRAAQAGLPYRVIDHRAYDSRACFRGGVERCAGSEVVSSWSASPASCAC